MKLKPNEIIGYALIALAILYVTPNLPVIWQALNLSVQQFQAQYQEAHK